MVNALNDGLNKPDQIAQGLAFQAGSFTASAATQVVTFATTFKATPVVIPGMAVSGAVASSPMVTAVNAGSCTIQVTSGLAYNWAAFGNL